jgi:phage terminase large subunit-like protein
VAGRTKGAPVGNRNAGKKFETSEPGPWMAWKERAPHTRCIRFIETYCRAPKGYGHGKPMRLGKFQKRWLRRILGDPELIAAILSLPRGNGKSTLLAAIAVWATFDKCSSGTPDVPIVATTVGQAMKSIYNVSVAMVEAEPELARRAKLYTAISDARIEALGGGRCYPIANDVDTLQGLDPTVAIMDEIGFQPLDSYNSLFLASGKREWSKILSIGTPGFDTDNALWWLRSKIQDGAVMRGVDFTEYAADENCDHTDERQWHKANPALAEGFMRIHALRAAVDSTLEAHFRIFRLGQWVDGVDSWLGEDGRAVWRALVDPWALTPGVPTYGGLDVGIKRDSTALVLVQLRPDGRRHAACKIWMPDASESLDVTDIMQYIREVDDEFDLRGLAYDPRLFELPAGQLAEEGIPMIEIPQSLERMTPAFGDLYQDIKDGQISVDDDKSFQQQILNGIPKWNQSGFTLKKIGQKRKIDAAYALAMALDRAKHPVKERPPLAAV